MNNLKEEHFNYTKSTLKIEQLIIQGDQMDEYQELQKEDLKKFKEFIAMKIKEIAINSQENINEITTLQKARSILFNEN